MIDGFIPSLKSEREVSLLEYMLFRFTLSVLVFRICYHLIEVKLYLLRASSLLLLLEEEEECIPSDVQKMHLYCLPICIE